MGYTTCSSYHHKLFLCNFPTLICLQLLNHHLITFSVNFFVYPPDKHDFPLSPPSFTTSLVTLMTLHFSTIFFVLQSQIPSFSFIIINLCCCLWHSLSISVPTRHWIPKLASIKSSSSTWVIICPGFAKCYRNPTHTFSLLKGTRVD